MTGSFKHSNKVVCNRPKQCVGYHAWRRQKLYFGWASENVSGPIVFHRKKLGLLQ